MIVSDISTLNFDANGLIPAIVQDETTKQVIMFAWMNHQSLLLTIETGQSVFYSRSRQEIWHKGSTSGNTQTVKSISVDCDSDALLIQVDANGPACHTGLVSCFDTAEIMVG